MKLTTQKLKELIMEEMDNMSKADVPEPEEKPTLKKDVENVLAQFKPTAQDYIDKIDNPAELQELLGELVKMIMGKGLTIDQFKAVANKIIRSTEVSPS
tara:strand:- start:273 stop:569 length:297 start_codon:yes stop_codon:yes gene_type:complete